MEITNVHGLPQVLVDAVKYDPYSRGKAKISVTQLIGPPKIAALQHRHEDELSEDVSTRIAALIGSLGHLLIERATKGKSDGEVERRFFVTIEGPVEPWILSGQADHIIDNTIFDYKFISVYKRIIGDFTDYERQLNVYAALARAHGHTIETLAVVAIYKDWKKFEALRDVEKGYPQVQAEIIDIPVWPIEDVRSFVREQVSKHQIAQKVTDDEITECDHEERWERSATIGVYKEGNVRATIRLKTEQDAFNWIKEKPEDVRDQYRVVVVPGNPVRCTDWCNVNKWCHWYQGYQSEVAKLDAFFDDPTGKKASTETKETA